MQAFKMGTYLLQQLYWKLSELSHLAMISIYPSELVKHSQPEMPFQDALKY